MTSETAIRPFRIAIPEADLDDLTARLDRCRWPDDPIGDDWQRGVPLSYLKPLADYWAHTFDWRAQEARLNEVPQFITEIDGQEIHFLHVRSPEPDARAMILTHGWPSSPMEFLELIGPLTDPRAHGGDPADAFHIVIPSLPGYGFSPLRGTGWGNLYTVAQAWAELMERLGYQDYAVHGTDAGGGAAMLLAMVAPEQVLGVHLTGTGQMPFGPPIDTTGLSPADQARAERFHRVQAEGLGYLHLQATRPQTLAYSLTDSPVGQLAWIVDSFQAGTDPAATVPEDAVGLDQLLTNVSIFWFTASGATSAHATYEGMQVYRAMTEHQSDSDSGWAIPADAPPAPPVGYAIFTTDNTIRSLTDPTGQVEHWTEYESGGHFPAMEVPEILVQDLRTFFGTLRSESASTE